MKPARGEIWQVDPGIAGKVRPALILSVAYGDHDRVIVTIVSHTTTVRGSEFEVPVTMPNFKPGVFDCQSVGGIHPKDALRRLGRLDERQLAAVEDGVRRWLGL